MPRAVHHKRKVFGLVALTIACVGVAGWVSSIGREQSLLLTQKDRFPLAIVSRDHYLCVIVAHHSLPLDASLSQMRLGWDFFGHSSPESNEDYWTLANFDSPGITKSHRYLGPVLLGTNTDTTPTYRLTKWYVSVPYWLIVVPFTVLAGWLLTCRPASLPSRSNVSVDPSDRHSFCEPASKISQ